MIEIKNKVDCCGCNACGDVCPKGAITFKVDEEGFWYPEINHDLCINCDLCDKVCPIINISELKKNDLDKPICYAAENKDLEVVFDSTSGGLFSALANVVYKSHGYVGGAVFNPDFSVKHYISADKKDLPRLRSSKYLQSNLDGFYKDVKKTLATGEMVLVCGCPCQMAALRRYLRKDYDNLIISDFICLGINSPKVWRKYLDSFEERYGSKVVYCKAKSKEYGWRNLTQKVILENGKICYETSAQSNFTKGYIQTHAYARPSCYDCQFKGYPRISDITLADFWGIERIDKSMEKNLGTSLVLLNSQKGVKFFEQIKKSINYKEVPLDLAQRDNPALRFPMPKPSIDRKQFFEDVENLTFLQLADKYINCPRPVTVRSVAKKALAKVRLLKAIFGVTRGHLKPVYRLFKLNTLREIWTGNVLVTTPYCTLEIAKNAKIEKKGLNVIGAKMRFKKSKLETRLLVGSGATLKLGGASIGYGSDVEVFDNSILEIGKGVATNIGFTLICGNHIQIDDDVMIGRNVTVRDNNGSHYINRKGYKNSAPVRIGKKSWLCEQCTIMNGVHVGEGCIVGAKSFVIKTVPDHCLVSGHPAEVVDEDVLWKY